MRRALFLALALAAFALAVLGFLLAGSGAPLLGFIVGVAGLKAGLLSLLRVIA